MNREQAETLLAELVVDELNEPQRSELLAYLKTDPALAERLGDMRLAAGLLREGLEQASAEAPTALEAAQRAELLALVEREPIVGVVPAVVSEAIPGAGTLFSFRVAGAAAACIALGVGVVGITLPELGVERMTHYEYEAQATDDGYSFDDYESAETYTEVPDSRLSDRALPSDVGGTLGIQRADKIVLRGGGDVTSTNGNANQFLSEASGTLALGDGYDDYKTEYFFRGYEGVSAPQAPVTRTNTEALNAPLTHSSIDRSSPDLAAGWKEETGQRLSSMIGGQLPESQTGRGVRAGDAVAEAGAANFRFSREANEKLDSGDDGPVRGLALAPATDPVDLGGGRADERDYREGGQSGGGGGAGALFDSREAVAQDTRGRDTLANNAPAPPVVVAGPGGMPEMPDRPGSQDTPGTFGAITLADGWAGSGVGNDNHVEFESAEAPLETRYGKANGSLTTEGLLGPQSDSAVRRQRENAPEELGYLSGQQGQQAAARPAPVPGEQNRYAYAPDVDQALNQFGVDAGLELNWREIGTESAPDEISLLDPVAPVAPTNPDTDSFSFSVELPFDPPAPQLPGGESDWSYDLVPGLLGMDPTTPAPEPAPRPEPERERLAEQFDAGPGFDLNDALSNTSGGGRNSGGGGGEAESNDSLFGDDSEIAKPLEQSLRWVAESLEPDAPRFERDLGGLMDRPEDDAKPLIRDESLIAYDELLTYPGDWPELTDLRLKELEDGEAARENNQAAELALRQVVPINFENARLGDVVNYVRDTTGAHVAVNWPALERSGVTRQTPISLSSEPIPAEELLQRVLEQAGAQKEGGDKPGYGIVEGVVLITKLDDLRPLPEVRVYDINALLNRPSALSREERVARIIEVVKNNVDDPTRWNDTQGIIREVNGNLIVRTTADAHGDLAGLIERLETETEDSTQLDPTAIPPVNPWVLTEHDAQSTFALDTDTASYELARRTIREQAQLPPVVSVRMEEFVNRFDYQYPAGRDLHDTFTVHAEAGPAPFAGADSGGDAVVLLKVGVRGRVVARDQMKPAHYVFVIDASGSMAREDRLALVQRSLAMLLGQLGAADTVSLVSYETRPYLLLEHAPASDAQAILAAAATIQTGGSTNLTDGLKLGYQVAARHFAPGSVNRVILCSDGVANVGSDDAKQMLDAVAAYRKHGVTLMTVGVGVDGELPIEAASGAERFNDGLMEQLANRGDGHYVYLGSVEDAQRQFVEDLAATRPTIAYDAKIQVHFDPARVRRYRLIGYENRAIADRDFRNDAVDAGEVGSGQSATALYELELWPTPGGRAARRAVEETASLGTVYVRYRDARSGAIEETATALSPGVVRERTVAEDPRFYLAACAAEFAELLRDSEHATGGSYARLGQIAREVAAALPLDQDAVELAELIGRAEGLPRVGQ